jgi:integrase
LRSDFQPLLLQHDTRYDTLSVNRPGDLGTGPHDSFHHQAQGTAAMTSIVSASRRDKSPQESKKIEKPGIVTIPAHTKPEKPRPDWPLTPHPNGQWSKKLRKRVYYFGPWNDPDGALKRYLDTRDDLLAGRTPRARNDDRATLLTLSNEFLTLKQHKVDTGELSPRTFGEYKTTCQRLMDVLGKHIVVEEIQPQDLLKVRKSLSKTRGVVALGNEIGRVRVVLNFAYQEGIIDRPVRFGESFRKPSKATKRKSKASRELASGKKLFAPEDIRAMIDKADVHMRAMVLLAINSGCGNADLGRLPLQALDLAGGWLDYPRPKTGIARRVPLWPETIKAIRESLSSRQRPKNEDRDGSLVFVTKYGASWFKAETSSNPVSQAFRKLCVAAGVYRKGIGFYSLRHTFETVAGGSKDQVAVNHIMGHVDETMAGEYREHISDDRLVASLDTCPGLARPPRLTTARRVPACRA